MRYLLPIAPLLILVTATVAWGQQPTPPKIAINTDRQPLVQGEPFTLTIHIESSSRSDPEIRLPRFGGFRILRRSESHPMSFHFSFGFGKGRKTQSRKESNYNFVLVADKSGKFKLDPVLVTLDGVQYRGDVHTLKVIPASNAPQQPGTPPAPQQPVPTDPFGTASPSVQEETDLDGAKVSPDFFVQTHLSSKKAVVGEPIVMTIYLYAAANVTDLEVIREPGTEGFWAENLLPANRRYTTETVQVGGRLYDRGVLRKAVLFPINADTLTVAPTMVELVISRGGFFSTRRSVKRASLPVKVEVAALPSDNQPAGFDPANVGQFVYSAGVDRNEAKVGEPVMLTLTARGEGNLRNLVLPEVTELEGFKTYAPESEVDVQTQGAIVTGVRTAKILMIPKDAGKFTVPPIAWSYFDPKAGKYHSVSSKSQEITVHAGAGLTASQPSVSGAPVQKTVGQDRLNRQLRSILSRTNLKTGGNRFIATKPWFLLLAIGFPFIFFAVVVFSRTRRRFAENQIKGRVKRADGIAARRLAELGKSSTNLTSEAFFAELARILVGFLENRLETPVAGDTSSDLRARLLDRGFSADQAEQVITEMEGCDFARFAPSAGQERERLEALKRVDMLIKDLASVRVSPPRKENR